LAVYIIVLMMHGDTNIKLVNVPTNCPHKAYRATTCTEQPVLKLDQNASLQCSGWYKTKKLSSS